MRCCALLRVPWKWQRRSTDGDRAPRTRPGSGLLLAHLDGSRKRGSRTWRSKSGNAQQRVPTHSRRYLVHRPTPRPLESLSKLWRSTGNKSELRRPKSERSPKPEFRKRASRPFGLGFRIFERAPLLVGSRPLHFSEVHLLSHALAPLAPMVRSFALQRAYGQLVLVSMFCDGTAVQRPGKRWTVETGRMD
jgi:hypothetical protein